MKNKHLVLLFVGVVLSGLLIRWLPVRYRSFFHTALIRVDTAAMTGCVILQPGQPELRLERTETGWTAEQNRRAISVKPDDMTPLLSVLAELHSLRTVKTKRADTLGFTEDHQIAVRVFRNKRLVETFVLGALVMENGQPATYLQLPLHEGVYLVPGQPRHVFAHTLDDFRDKTAVPPDVALARRIELSWTAEETPVIFEKNDTTNRWETPNRSVFLNSDSVQNWLVLFQGLNGSPFADYFDESQANKTRLATVQLGKPDSGALTLQFFYLKPPDVPEDLSELRRQHLHRLPAYVFHSSDNPMNYFAVADSNLVQFLCFGLWNKKSG